MIAPATLNSPRGAPRCAIVTGAGSGIGRATACALVEDGWSLILAGRRAVALEETKAIAGLASPEALPRILAVATDICDEDAVARLFATAVATFGRVDLLFNNAGVNVANTPLDQLTPAQWRQVIEVNLTAAFLCTAAAFRVMKAQTPQGGRIINNGSISAHAPRPNSAAYTASKHAITGLTKSASLDGRPYNIACGQIDIGNAASDMTSAMSKGVPQADGRILPEPVMDVRHVADAVVHMARLPLEANIQFLMVMATAMPLIGRG